MENVKNSQNVSVNSDSLNHGLNENNLDLLKFVSEIDDLIHVLKLKSENFLDLYSIDHDMYYWAKFSAYESCYCSLKSIRFNNLGFKSCCDE